MSKIQRDNFTRQNANKSIDLDKLAQNRQAKETLQEGGMTVDQLRQADANRDGQIDAGEAWQVADDFDRDGSRGSLIDTDAAGRVTPAGKSLNALGLVLQNREVQGEARARPPRDPQANDDILLVGMNNETLNSAGAKHEIQQLRNRGANVTAVTDSRAGDDKISAGGRTYDLNDEGQRLAFAQTLGLPQEQSQKIADAIGTGQRDAKDELAQIAQVWAKGERGERMPSRMVLSGHHVGSAVWGDGNGRLTWTALKSLSDAMPTATSKVEDLHIAACYSGGKDAEGQYRGIFPNLKTIWAYSGSAPGAGSGATLHEAAWESATRGRATDIASSAANLKRRGIRKADNIYTGQTRPFSQVLSEVQGGERMFQQHFTGEQSAQSSQSGPLFDWYGRVQELLNDHKSSLEPGQRDGYSNMRDVAVRLRFYNSHVRHKFQDTYGDELRAGYRKLGISMPDFANMSRGEAMASITQFREAYEAQGQPRAAADALARLNGLWNLDGQTIPENWI